MTRSIKQTLKRILPGPVMAAYHRGYLRVRRWRNRGRPAREVFTRVYADNQWGGEEGEFCSGQGSDERFAAPYVALVAPFLRAKAGELGRRVVVVDLGCGDFRVGGRLVGDHVSYIGVDVVPALVDRNARAFGGEHVDFRCLDIVDDPLPEGDVCLLRQVLQHLSNAQILAVLDKLSQYDHVFVTEHQPAEPEGFTPNLDKPHGADVRWIDQSSLYLELPPFNVAKLEEVVAVPHDDWGVLRTFRIDSA